jgi:hypothetical protein
MDGYYTTFIRKIEGTVGKGVCREFSILTILLLYSILGVYFLTYGTYSALYYMIGYRYVRKI